MKDGIALLSVGDRIPHTEFKMHAEHIRQQLENLQLVNEHIIKFKCQELDHDALKTDEAIEIAEQEIADEYESYYDEVRERSLPTMFELLRQTKRATSLNKHDPSWPKFPREMSVTAPRMAKLKFPTFSGDIRDYRRFKKTVSSLFATSR